MFSKMLGKMKSSSSDNQEKKELIDRISKMNLTDMRAYINNRVPDFPVDEEGLSEVLHKLLEVDEKTSKRYIDIDDMDYVFHLFIAISSKTKNKRLAYQPLDEALTALVADYQANRNIELGRIVPYSLKGLIVYKMPLTVRGFKGEDYV